MFMRLCIIFFVSMFLSACGEQSGFYDKPRNLKKDLTNTQLGILEGDVFTAGKIKLATPNLKALASSKLSVYLVDEDGNRYTDSASVSFTSDCSKQNFANITSPVDAVNGLVEATYTANGCVGDDLITATAMINGKEITATATINVEAAVVNSLRYMSATPSSLGIKGFGQVEESTVQFKIMDRNGQPVPNQKVNFSLNSATGGINLYPASAISDEQGVVQTVIHSGTTATNVRVTATYDNDQSITATSDILTISTGVADQNSLSLSASVFNPNAANYDGTEVDITAWAADHFNNPVPDGTKIYFTTEGGQIEPECETVKGTCTVKWHSSNPRPCYGRATILATMVGEESFIDANGNGMLDNDETFYDMDEAFRDDNEDGVYNEKNEEFWDFNQNGKYDLADGKYNGVLCKNTDNAASQCSPDVKNIYARDSLTLVMASDIPHLQVYVYDPTQNKYVEHIGGLINVPAQGTSIAIALSGQLGNVDKQLNCEFPHEQEDLTYAMVGDNSILQPANELTAPNFPAGYQPMPAGTTVKVSLDKGVLAPKAPEMEIGSTNQDTPSYMYFSVAPKEDAEKGTGGVAEIVVETSGSGNIKARKTTFSLGFTFPEGGIKTLAASATGSTTNSSTDTNTYEAIPNSIQFVSATPKQIGIKGFGMNESSRLTFLLEDQKGNLMPNETISFSLNTSIGGIKLSNTTATTDESGLAYVYVNSGNVATNVRVMAKLDSNPDIFTQSDNLVISTGVADQNSFTLYADTLNPEALEWNNEEVTISVIASDHFNNPVPDGTSVSFMAEGGQIEPSCLIQDGRCSVTWRSSQPRPSDGRVTILATMLGEESFTDLNGNGIKDDGDLFDDRGEAYLDSNENGRYDAGSEEFKDFNQNGIRDAGDGKYNGILCDASNCSDNRNIYVRSNLVLALSGSYPVIKFFDPDTGTEMNKIDASETGTAQFKMQITDVNGNPMPKGTVVSYNDGTGKQSFTIGSSNSPIAKSYDVIIYNYETSASDPKPMFFQVEVVTPNDVKSTVSREILPFLE